MIVHQELWKSKVCLELLRAPYFSMYENVSAIVPPVKDLTIRPLNQLVEERDFVLGAVHRAKYSSYHTMEEEIYLLLAVSAFIS